VMLTLENAPVGQVRLPGVEIEPVRTGGSTARFEITFEMTGGGGEPLGGQIEYATDLFAATTMKRLGAHVRSFVEAAARSPGTPVGSISLLSGEERREVLYGWNGTEETYPRGSTLLELLRAQALRTPESVAVEHGPRRLTYRSGSTDGSCRAHRWRSYIRAMAAVRDRCPACARRLITTRFDTTFRLPDRSERLCFGIPGGLCEDCSQLYIDPDLIELLDLGEGRCVFAIESDLVVQEQAWSSGH